MKRFSQFKLKIELILLFAVGVILLLDYAFQAYYSVLHVQAQLQQQQSSPIIGIKITSPVADQQLPVGELTISGISTDNSTADCTVYADWNNLKPFQTAVATGPGGVNDYSTWNFTYTPQYHIITNGTNNLTSKLSCVDDSNGGTANLTKNYSIDVIGIATTRAAAISTQGEVQKQQQSSAIDNNNSLIKGISNTDNNNATTLDNETKVVVEEEIPTGNNNISKPSIPMPIVAESYLNPNTVNVNFTSPVAGQQVPAGNLTVTGTSSDNSTTDCQIWLGWNEQKPFQTAVATGPGGVNDYSTWNFTYTPQYHIITNGTNNLAAQISCFNSNTLANITKSYSVNVTGIIESSEQSALAAQNISSSLPSVKIDNNDDNRTATTPPPQIIPSVPTTSPLPLQPSIKDDEEKEQTEDEPEPESEPQPTTSLTEDDKTEEDTDEEENPSEQGKEVEEVQEEEEVQEQLQQILEKVGKVEQDVQQKVGKIEEDILEEIENGLR